MSRKPEGYWERRSTELLKNIEDNTIFAINDLIVAYNKATEDINREITKIFGKYVSDSNLSKKEAKTLLSKRETDEFYKELLDKINTIDDKDIKKQLLAKYNAPAYAYRINRYQALQENIDIELKKLAGIEKDITKLNYVDTITEGYYHSIFNIQKGLKKGFNFSQIDRKTIELMLNNKWNGSNYSQRIWKNNEKLYNYLKSVLTAGEFSGKSVKKISNEINEALNIGLYNATRLVRTETNYFANQAEMLSYIECGIEEYQFIATLDHITCEHCAELDKRVFKVKGAKPGRNCPPIHPNDRCTTVAYFGEDNEDMQRIARDPFNNKNYNISNMSYDEWKKQYGEDAINKYHKMYTNEKRDKVQYMNYVDALGKLDGIETFAKFQDLKYNNIDDWKSLKADYSDKIGIYSEGQAIGYINSIPLKLREGMQNKHIEGSHNFEKGKSVVTISLDEIRTLVEENAGKGIKDFNRESGKWSKKEIITTNYDIGYVYSDNGNKIYTKSFKIHYSKKGYHIVPYLEGDERKNGD